MEYNQKYFEVIILPEIGSLEKSFSMILRIEMMSVVSYKRKNIIFYEKNFKIMKNNTFHSFFLIEFFLIIASYQFF